MEKIKRPPKRWSFILAGPSFNSRVNDIRDLLMFGKEIKVFLNTY